jgi:hypothetical protein
MPHDRYHCQRSPAAQGTARASPWAVEQRLSDRLVGRHLLLHLPTETTNCLPSWHTSRPGSNTTACRTATTNRSPQFDDIPAKPRARESKLTTACTWARAKPTYAQWRPAAQASIQGMSTQATRHLESCRRQIAVVALNT